MQPQKQKQPNKTQSQCSLTFSLFCWIPTTRHSTTPAAWRCAVRTTSDQVTAVENLGAPTQHRALSLSLLLLLFCFPFPSGHGVVSYHILVFVFALSLPSGPGWAGCHPQKKGRNDNSTRRGGEHRTTHAHRAARGTHAHTDSHGRQWRTKKATNRNTMGRQERHNTPPCCAGAHTHTLLCPSLATLSRLLPPAYHHKWCCERAPHVHCIIAQHLLCATWALVVFSAARRCHMSYYCHEKRRC